MYDLSKMYWRLDLLEPGENIRDKFPEFNLFTEFIECTDDMLKIAALMSDVDSPFIRIKEREIMVKAILDYLHIDTKTNQSMIEKIVAYRHPKIMGAWLRCLQILHENEFTDWVLARKDFDFFLMQSNEPKFEKESDLNYYKKRVEIRERVSELGKEVRRIEAKLFPDSKAAREAAIIEQGMKISLWAERYAETNTYV